MLCLTWYKSDRTLLVTRVWRLEVAERTRHFPFFPLRRRRAQCVNHAGGEACPGVLLLCGVVNVNGRLFHSRSARVFLLL